MTLTVANAFQEPTECSHEQLVTHSGSLYSSTTHESLCQCHHGDGHVVRGRFIHAFLIQHFRDKSFQRRRAFFDLFDEVLLQLRVTVRESKKLTLQRAEVRVILSDI